jgi:hypothetical protein
MLHMMTAKPPAVQISDGLRIDDAFAARLVDRMLHSLHDEFNAIDFNMHKELDRRASLGNPKGQKRVFARMCKAAHNAILAAGITTGTRYRFNIRFDLWTATGSDEQDSEKGPLSWLVGRRLEISSKGVKQETKTDMLELAGLSRHALERLVQRGMCHTEQDFIKVLKRAWLMLSLSVFSIFESGDLDDTSWTLPVELETGETIYLAAIRNKRKGPYVLVTTVLSEDMGIDVAAVEPLRSMLKDYEGMKDVGTLLKDERLIPALKATAKATRMGRRQA